METSICTFIRTKTGIHPLTLFAYSSHGMPGIEILGLGQKGRLIKEKMLYLTRKKKIKLPLKRYCLCVDPQTLPKKMSTDMTRTLEIPFILMLWFLGGYLKIHKLDDCLAVGYFNIEGEFFFESLETERLHHQKHLSIGVGESIEASALLPDFKIKSKEYQ